MKTSDNEGSGGNFSVGYIVKRDDQTAFLKAIDLSRAMRAAAGDMLNELKKIIDTAAFEKALGGLCGQRRMDRVVLALATGDIVLGPNLQDRLPYIIFELADGDVRRRMRLVNDNVRASWIFRAVQNAAVGLTQLHSIKIAHQDMKPSNLLHFEKQSVFKVGDVGRAIQEGIAVPHAEYGVAGDPNYAPPELLYGYFTPDWNTRRLGCDLFMFGSLIAFFFLGQGVTPMLMSRIDPPFLPRQAGGQWQGTYADVVPVVRRAFSSVLEELELVVPALFRKEVVASQQKPNQRLRCAGYAIAILQIRANTRPNEAIYLPCSGNRRRPSLSTITTLKRGTAP